MDAAVIRGSSALWLEHPQLCRDLQPHSSDCHRQWQFRGYFKNHAVYGRKKRSRVQSEEKAQGAFWEDRYQATAMESGNHLRQCLVYVDLNMVRAGVVDHPDQWRWGGYNEIQWPKEPCRIIDNARLQRLLNSNTEEDLAEPYKQWVDSKLGIKQTRQQHFSRSIAVGSEAFIAGVKEALGIRARGRNSVSGPDDGFHLKEPMPAYGKSTIALNSVYCKEYLEGIQVPWNVGTTQSNDFVPKAGALKRFSRGYWYKYKLISS